MKENSKIRLVTVLRFHNECNETKSIELGVFFNLDSHLCVPERQVEAAYSGNELPAHCLSLAKNEGLRAGFSLSANRCEPECEEWNSSEALLDGFPDDNNVELMRLDRNRTNSRKVSFGASSGIRDEAC